MALTPEIDRQSRDTIALSRKLAAYTARLDTSTRELKPEHLVVLTRIIGEHAKKLLTLSSSIRFNTKRHVRKSRAKEAKRGRVYTLPPIPETSAATPHDGGAR